MSEQTKSDETACAHIKPRRKTTRQNTGRSKIAKHSGGVASVNGGSVVCAGKGGRKRAGGRALVRKTRVQPLVLGRDLGETGASKAVGAAAGALRMSAWRGTGRWGGAGGRGRRWVLDSWCR